LGGKDKKLKQYEVLLVIFAIFAPLVENGTVRSYPKQKTMLRTESDFNF
jgi:hypothetical protein